MIPVSRFAPSLLVLLVASACGTRQATKGRLDHVADSLAMGKPFARCGKPIMLVQMGKPPQESCDAVLGDTTVSVLRDAAGAVVLVAKHWPAGAGASLRERYDAHLRTLTTRFGAAALVCYEPPAPSARSWITAGLTITSYVSLSRGEIGDAFSESSIRGVAGCVDT